MMKEFKKLMDCLNKQITELESLCRLKDRRISELEKQVFDLENKSNSSKEQPDLSRQYTQNEVSRKSNQWR